MPATHQATPGAADSFVGTGVADYFLFPVAELTGDDTIVGGDSNVEDVFRFTTSGTVTADSLAHVTGVERIQFGGGGPNAITLTDAVVRTALNQILRVDGTAGDDRVDGRTLGLALTIDVTARGGNDTLLGGASDDVFRFAAADLTASDTVSGGGGRDRLLIETAGTVNLAGVTGVETVTLANGHNLLTLTNPIVAAAGGLLEIYGQQGSDWIDASALTAANRVDLSSGGGDDRLTGGAGDDIFRFKASTLFSTDFVDGRAGNDTLILSGAGAANLVNLRHVEAVALANGGISIELTDPIVASLTSARIAVTGSAGDDIVDAHKLTGANALDLTAAGGADTLLGGAGADNFLFRTGDLTAADTVNGGGGGAIDTLRFTDGGAVTAAALAGVSKIERIALADAGTTLGLGISLFNDDLRTVTVIGGAGDDRIDGSAVTSADNHLDIAAGAGTDTLIGGAGGDRFRFAAADLTAADSVNGGGGYDRLTLSTAGAVTLAGIRDVERVELANGTNSVTLNNGFVSSSTFGSVLVVGNEGADTFDATRSTPPASTARSTAPAATTSSRSRTAPSRSSAGSATTRSTSAATPPSPTCRMSRRSRSAAATTR